MSESDTPQLSETISMLLNRTDTRLWLMFFLIVGLASAAVIAPEGWSGGRRLVAGLLFGVGGTFCVILPRIIGGQDFN